MNPHPKLVLFPGLGADDRLFTPQRSLPIDIEVPPWIEPTRRESLSSYAARIARTIQTRPPFWLGGISFGGMLAQEVARHTPHCQGVILISSCRSRHFLPKTSILARPLVPWVPTRLLHFTKSLTAPARLLFGANTREQVRLFNTMLQDTPPAFLHWSLCTALAWPGAGDLTIPVHHIHGSNDHVIPCPKSPDVTAIPGAGHLLSLTHADQVNQFILDRIATTIACYNPTT